MESLRRIMLTRTLDPESPFIQQWNKFILISCLISVCIDPLLSYTHVVDAHRLCLYLDQQLATVFCLLRTLVDVFYVLHIFFRLRTGFIASSHSRVYASGELVKDSTHIIQRYLQSYFIMDILSILPLPQVVIMIAIRAKINPLRIRPMIILTIGQNLVRVVRIYPLLKEVNRIPSITTAWAGTASNFFFYMLASHVIGSFWYLTSVERVDKCWRLACANDNDCNLDGLYCGRGPQQDNLFLNASCSPHQPSEPVFAYGIFLDALDIQLYHDVFSRFYYCFVWGLRNLSSLGQNLKTSNHITENLFVVLISVTGLILFSFLAGNIQRYLQSLTVRKDEMMMKLRDQELWMSNSRLPQDLRVRVRQHEQYKWQKKKGVDEESLIRDLPKDLRRDIKRHQCRSLLIRVPVFEKMDGMLLDALCCRLKPVLYTENTCIFHGGDPVDEMLFIKRGKILSINTNLDRSGSVNTIILKAGDFCGEELLTWAFNPNSSSTLPISTTTLQAINDVEVFCLMPDDLKCVASQFRNFHSQQQLDHIFRFNSQQWRSWGACIIQVAWRRYYMRKMRSLKQAEDRLQDVLSLQGENSST